MYTAHARSGTAIYHLLSTAMALLSGSGATGFCFAASARARDSAADGSFSVERPTAASASALTAATAFTGCSCGLAAAPAIAPFRAHWPRVRLPTR